MRKSHWRRGGNGTEDKVAVTGERVCVGNVMRDSIVFNKKERLIEMWMTQTRTFPIP